MLYFLLIFKLLFDKGINNSTRVAAFCVSNRSRARARACMKAPSYKSKRTGAVQSALIEREIPPLRRN